MQEHAQRRVSDLTEQIIASAIEVHRALGPGLLESAYEACLVYELTQRGLRFERQVALPVASPASTSACSSTSTSGYSKMGCVDLSLASRNSHPSFSLRSLRPPR